MRPPGAYSAAVATEWFQLALQLIQQTPGQSAPVASRALVYLGLSLYESVAPGLPQPASLAGQLNELESLPWAQPDEPLHWPSVAWNRLGCRGCRWPTRWWRCSNWRRPGAGASSCR